MKNIPFVDLKSQYISIKKDIDLAIQEVIENTSFIGGENVKKFGLDFAKLLGAKHCIPVSNGTDAIYITLKMLGIGNGDEVITTASSWISTSETISQTGAKPVFVDIEEEYYTIDPVKIEEKITSKTKAIIPVHLYGQSCEMDKIMAIAKQHNLFVIEDCAQSHLTEYKGKIVGTIGDAGTFSFYPGKNLGAYGDAGCIVTNNDSLAEKCKMYANHGALVKHTHLIEGINSRMDGLQAAILNVKLPHLNSWTDLRISNARLYEKYLKDFSELTLPKIRPESKHSFHVYCIKVENRDEVNAYINEKGVNTAIHYPTALPFMPCYKYLNHNEKDFPVAAQHHNKIISLPMYPELTEEDIKYISEVFKEVL